MLHRRHLARKNVPSPCRSIGHRIVLTAVSGSLPLLVVRKGGLDVCQASIAVVHGDSCWKVGWAIAQSLRHVCCSTAVDSTFHGMRTKGKFDVCDAAPPLTHTNIPLASRENANIALSCRIFTYYVLVVPKAGLHVCERGSCRCVVHTWRFTQCSRVDDGMISMACL